ncbi:MAG: hypothetical protein HRT68_10595 [Flavobacteriaceae bacterium]|nr:hypothetical protein [Flavobacteriaceae bacterium]
MLSNTTEALTSAVLHTETITITQTTLVEVSFHLGVNILQNNETFASDGMPRLYDALVSHVGSGDYIVCNSGSYTNEQTTETITTGYFTLSGNGFIELAPGMHQFEMLGFANGSVSQGYRVEFGANAIKRFQFIFNN